MTTDYYERFMKSKQSGSTATTTTETLDHLDNAKKGKEPAPPNKKTSRSSTTTAAGRVTQKQLDAMDIQSKRAKDKSSTKKSPRIAHKATDSRSSSVESGGEAPRKRFPKSEEVHGRDKRRHSTRASSKRVSPSQDEDDDESSDDDDREASESLGSYDSESGDSDSRERYEKPRRKGHSEAKRPVEKKVLSLEKSGAIVQYQRDMVEKQSALIQMRENLEQQQRLCDETRQCQAEKETRLTSLADRTQRLIEEYRSAAERHAETLAEIDRRCAELDERNRALKQDEERAAVMALVTPCQVELMRVANGEENSISSDLYDRLMSIDIVRALHHSGKPLLIRSSCGGAYTSAVVRRDDTAEKEILVQVSLCNSLFNK